MYGLLLYHESEFIRVNLWPMSPKLFAANPANRLVSLDVFRGVTIAAMVLVNNPGTWSNIYSPLEHAEWNGWTPTDLVFPFFLFIVGVSITFAFARRVEEGSVKRDLYLKVLKRSAIIFGLGLFLNGFPYFNLGTIRIAGVLQRIAVCYLIASLIFLTTKARTQLLIAVALLIAYCLVMTNLAAPGYAPGDLSKEGSIASFIDRVVLRQHIWKQGRVYDPEGLLSTIPAVVTTLLGILTGHWLRTERPRYEKVVGMFVAGAICVALGWAWNPFFPINKALWTSSYVLFTAGLALEFLALCYWVIDIQGYRRWAWPFEVFGVNALALFVGTGLMVKLMGLLHVQGWIFRSLFLSWAQPINASLFYAIAFILLWLFLMWLLYRKRIFIKV
jgi:predicted acyltransferase